MSDKNVRIAVIVLMKANKINIEIRHKINENKSAFV